MNSSSNVIEPMQVDWVPDTDGNGTSCPPSNNNQEIDTPHVDIPAIDIDAYVSQYRSQFRIQRLLFVADHCAPLRAEALQHAFNAVQNTLNVECFKTIRARQAAIGVTPSPEDSPWIEATSRRAAQRQERLESDLSSYKSNSIKESIRRAHVDLGDHWVDCGDLQKALRCYSQARYYTTAPRHIVAMCFNVIKVVLLLRDWNQVLGYVSKAEMSCSSDLNANELTRLHVAAGIAYMALGQYRAAAKRFSKAIVDHCPEDFVSPSCVAWYGGLCSLASLPRQELIEVVTALRGWLETEPIVRDALSAFHSSDYSTCFRLIDTPVLLLDPYIASRVAELNNLLRRRALCQYLSAYNRVDMMKMSRAFNTDSAALQTELAQLIQDGHIAARIDSSSKVLHACEVDARTSSFEAAINAGRAYQRRTAIMLVRCAVSRHQLLLRQGKDSDHSSGRTSPV